MYMAGHRAKQSDLWYSVVVVICIRGTLDLLMLRSFWGHSVQLSRNDLNSTTNDCSAKWSEIWDSAGRG